MGLLRRNIWCVIFLLRALVCRSCIDLDLHKEARLFEILIGVLLLSLVSVDWPKCISDIRRAKRRMVLAPSRLRLGFRRISGVLDGGDKDCGLLIELVKLGVMFCRFHPDLVLLLRVT